MDLNLKRLLDEIRLYLAERLILGAVQIAPRGHPDSAAIAEAALHVYRRGQS